MSSIGLTEHIGAKNLAGYARFLAGKLRPQGRLLNHCITRPVTTAPPKAGGFINRYVFPDGELEGVGTIVSVLQDNGLEVRHEENFREHYARTCAAWGANLEDHWDEAVAEVGEGRARVWRLYLAASRLGFVQRRIELHQVLAVRTERGVSGMPLERLTFARTIPARARPLGAQPAAGLAGATRRPRRAARAWPRRRQPVLTIRTALSAPCATELGTEPSTRRAPRMPLLPTTIRSAPIDRAVSTMASAAAPGAAWAPVVRPWPQASTAFWEICLAASVRRPSAGARDRRDRPRTRCPCPAPTPGRR